MDERQKNNTGSQMREKKKKKNTFLEVVQLYAV